MKPLTRFPALYAFLTETEPKPISKAASILGRVGNEVRRSRDRLKIAETTARLKEELGAYGTPQLQSTPVTVPVTHR